MIASDRVPVIVAQQRAWRALSSVPRHSFANAPVKHEMFQTYSWPMEVAWRRSFAMTKDSGGSSQVSHVFCCLAPCVAPHPGFALIGCLELSLWAHVWSKRPAISLCCMIFCFVHPRLRTIDVQKKDPPKKAW